MNIVNFFRSIIKKLNNKNRLNQTIIISTHEKVDHYFTEIFCWVKKNLTLETYTYLTRNGSVKITGQDTCVRNNSDFVLFYNLTHL